MPQRGLLVDSNVCMLPQIKYWAIFCVLTIIQLSQHKNYASWVMLLQSTEDPMICCVFALKKY